MQTLSLLIFVATLLASLVKSLALVHATGNGKAFIRWLVGIGLLLEAAGVVVLAVVKVHFSFSSTLLSSTVASIALVFSAVVAVITEAVNVWEKLRNRSYAEDSVNQRRYVPVFKWVAFAVAMLAALYALLHFFIRRSDYTSIRLLVAIAVCTLVVLVCAALFSCFARIHYELRTIVSLSILVIGVLLALALVHVTWARNAVPHRINVFSTYAAAFENLVAAAVCWRLSDVAVSGLTVHHVHSLETVAFGATAPALALGITVNTDGYARRALLAAVSQLGALVLPIAVSFFAVLFMKQPSVSVNGGVDPTPNQRSTSTENQEWR